MGRKKQMASRLIQIFGEEKLVARIQKRLPYLFQIAELEASRAGKVGMEVGTLREKIIIALLIYKFGEENVDTDIPITEAEIDVKLFGESISIKTITGKSLGGVKLVWTVDAQSAKIFSKNYAPSCDMIFIQINWDGDGSFNYIPLETQKRIFEKLGRRRYIKLPKPGTNPRGVEMTREAMELLLKDRDTRRISISWRKTKIEYNAYKRWVEYWEAEDESQS